MDDKNDIIDAEIVDDASVDSNTLASDPLENGSDDAAVLISLEELIKNHIETVDKLKVELRQHREMYEDSFESNPLYREVSEKAKEATKAKLAQKKQIGQQPSVALLAQKVKDLRIDLSETNQTLSDLVSDYKEKTGATQIETRDGKIMEIVSTVKLVKLSSK